MLTVMHCYTSCVAAVLCTGDTTGGTLGFSLKHPQGVKMVDLVRIACRGSKLHLNFCHSKPQPTTVTIVLLAYNVFMTLKRKQSYLQTASLYVHNQFLCHLFFYPYIGPLSRQFNFIDPHIKARNL